MVLAPRLAAVVGLIPSGARVADIGTDHAMLPISLVRTGKSDRVIASDLNEKPFRAALQNVQSSGVSGMVEVRRGDGLEVLKPGEVNVIVIAGMGGNTITGILGRSPGVLAGVTRLIIQPMSDPGHVRLWLARNGWRIVDEELVREDERLYVIMAAEPGEETCTDPFLLEMGPVLLNKCSPELIEYLERIKHSYQRVLSSLAGSRSESSMEKAVEMTARLSRLREVICRCRQGVK